MKRTVGVHAGWLLLACKLMPFGCFEFKLHCVFLVASCTKRGRAISERTLLIPQLPDM